MSVEEKLHRYERLDFLIRTGSTGTLENLANLLGLSISATKNHIADLRTMGAEIVYSRRKKSYVYATPCKLIVNFKYIFEKFS